MPLAAGNNAHELGVDGTKCPTPNKLQFASREDAAAHARGMSKKAAGAEVSPYECECGAWHLTSQTQRVQRVVARKVQQRSKRDARSR